ncbi:MAG: class I SAM-dependent rRNA methyltransferase [Gammaproteobacteria bacterium]|nr:class I SAM-dependent rRNA methyltransferase [Gammaproteobacteria bacterium]
MSQLPPLRLKKQEENRLKAGHLWIFSNEIDTQQTPLSGFTAGEAVEIQTHKGQVIGSGYINPHSLICARLLSRDPKHPWSASLLVHRLNVALSLRDLRYPDPYYRLIFGEADLLPGLVVDRYGDTLVVQLTTAGMELMKADVLTALEKVLHPKVILLRNDSPIRNYEKLPSYVETVLGEMPEHLLIKENGLSFEVPFQEGQKTGWFYDQRENRARLAPYVKGKRVLDVYSYMGGWGVTAAALGASDVTCVDASQTALDYVHHNAALNGQTDKVQTLQGDAQEAMKELRQQREKFDVVIIDPPAFIKKKVDFRPGIKGYRKINQQAMQLTAKDGILVSASCSHHLPRQVLQKIMQESAVHLDRNLQILEHGYQGPDHPIHPAIPETEYLKVIYSRVLSRH